MSTVEDLNRIKKANDILNKGFQRVGAKPIYIDSSMEESINVPNSGKIEFDFKPQIELLNQVSAKLKKEKELKIKPKQKDKSSKLIGLVIFIAVITLIYLGFYVYTPEKILSKVRQLTSKVIVTPQSTNEIEETTVTSSGEKSFIISSGIFKNKADANNYKNDLANKLGIPLKVVRAENFYTIQIGPDYQEQEDVLVVFDELSRYNIKNLSVRMQS
jgi:cell division protein FtsN